MATLNISGQSVTVDDSFLKLPPDQQNATVDEIAKSIGNAGSGSTAGAPNAAAPNASAAPQPPAATNSAGYTTPPVTGPNNTAPKFTGSPTALRVVVRGANPILPGLAPASTSATDQAASVPEPVAPSGPGYNAAAGINDALDHIVGAPVDLTNTAMRAAAAGVHAVGGPDIELPVDPIGGHQSIADALTNIGIRDPATVVSSGEGDNIARAAGEGVGYTVAPEAAVAALGKLGIIGPTAQSLAAFLAGDAKSVPAMAGNAAAGAAGGATGQAAQDAAPAPLKPLAGTLGALAGGGLASVALAAPAMVKAGVGLARDAVAPLSQAGRQRVAGQTLVDAAESPTATLAALRNPAPPLVPGSEPTTFQQTGDMGLGALERGARAKYPDQFKQREADQNAARLAATEGLQSTGAPEQVSNGVRDQLAQIDQQTYQSVKAATDQARGEATKAGMGASPEIVGNDIRRALEGARGAAKQQEDALWQAVDPDGDLAISPTNTTAAAADIQKTMAASARPPGGEEAAVYSVLGKYGDVVPFNELAALHSRLNEAMRYEVEHNGKTASYARMSRLNSAIFDDLNSAVVAKVAQEQRAVAAGTMAPADTVSQRVQEWRDAWYQQRKQQTGTIDLSGAGNDAAARSPAISGSRGTASTTGVGIGNPSRDPRLSPDGLEANFDEAALERLTTARQATVDRANTFDNRTLGPILQRPATTAPYNMGDSAVAARSFRPGPTAFDSIKALRAAIGDGPALTALRDYAVNRLRQYALRDDGTFDPVKLASWRKAHADALRAFPALDAQLSTAAKASQAMEDANAARKIALDDAQQGALGKLIKVDDPADVTRVVGSIFGRQDSIKQMSAVRQAIGNDPEARAGLRKAVVDYMLDKFVSNTEAATSGLGTMKADQFQTFVAQNKGALHVAGFSNTEVALMDDIAADLQRANRSLTAVKLAGSNTTQDVLAAKAMDSPSSMLMKIAIASVLSAEGTNSVGGPFVGTAVGIATALLAVLRQNGVKKIDDLVAQALLDPQLARMLMAKAKPAQIKAAAMTIGQRFRRASLAGIAAQ